MNTPTIEKIGTIPARELLRPMIWVSTLVCMSIFVTHLDPIDIHSIMTGFVMLMNLVAFILDRYGRSMLGLHFFYAAHTIAMVLPGFLGIGRIVDVIMVPSIMFWALMSLSDRRILLTYMAVLTVLGAAAIWQLRALAGRGVLKMIYVEDMALAVGILLGLYMAARGFFRRIGEYKELKENNEVIMRAKNAELQQHINTNLQLESFAHMASDALSHPLDDVMYHAAEFKRKAGDKLSESQTEYLNFVSQQARQMNELTTGLLALSKLSTEDTDKRSINTRGLVDRLMQGQFVDRSHAIKIGRLPAQISANPMQIHTLLKNLIDNAFKYAHPDRDARVELTSTSDRAYHTFYIKDNGKGISDEQKENAFLIFKRLQHDGHGTGIGLATCRRIVEKHGGSISIKDNPTGGSIFIFTLPVD